MEESFQTWCRLVLGQRTWEEARDQVWSPFFERDVNYTTNLVQMKKDRYYTNIHFDQSILDVPEQM